MIPEAYTPEPRLAAAISAAEEMLMRAQEAKGRDKASRARVALAQRDLADLRAASEKLIGICTRNPGWRVFMYTDAVHRVVAVRFRLPYSKSFQSFKPTPVGGVFGHGVFSSDGSPRSIATSDPLIVTAQFS